MISGACEHVGPRHHAPEIMCDPEPNYMSKNKLVYTTASGADIPNDGQKKCKGMTRDWSQVALDINYTDTTKYLASVRKITQAGHKVEFNDKPVNGVAGNIINTKTGQASMSMKTSQHMHSTYTCRSTTMQKHLH